MISPHPSNIMTQVTYLAGLPGYKSLGACLKTFRENSPVLLTQDQVAKESERYCRSRHVPIIDRRRYGGLERDGRVPNFEELEPIFLTFADGYRIPISEAECKVYVMRAKERITGKRKGAQKIDSARWEELEESLIRHARSKHSHIRLVSKEELVSQDAIVEPKEISTRRLRAIEQAIQTDVSHLLEREKWVADMVAYLEEKPQKKIVVVQAQMGAGKTHALALLTQRLAEQKDEYYLIPYTFEAGEGKTPDDHLEVFMATILSDLSGVVSDDAKQRPIEERIEQVIAAIRSRSEQGQQVVLLLDDAQVVFPGAADWSPTWARFYTTYVRESHSATIYMMTRTWPGWPERRHTFVEELELPELSTHASVTIWQRSGYSDVSSELLERVSNRCGRNPQMLEMLAYQRKQRRYMLGWGVGGKVFAHGNKEKNANTVRLEALLEQDVIFDSKTDKRSDDTLQQAISSNLSHTAMRLMECLAASPLGLPVSLVHDEFARAQDAIEELISASLFDLTAAASGRAAIVPLAREAQLHTLIADSRIDGIEARVTDLYAYWLMTLQDFRDDAEKAGLIAEMVVRYIRQHQLLNAAELFIGFGWLCTLFGHVTRIQRVFEEAIKANQGKVENIEQKVGWLLLQHRLQVATGQKVARSERDHSYQYIYDKVLTSEVSLQPRSALEVLHNMRLFYSRNAQYTEANQMFDDTFKRLEKSEQLNSETYASFFYSRAQLFLSWSEKYEQDTSEMLHYTQVAMNMLKESIVQWRLCLKNALPLQEHHTKYELARALNDYAYTLRRLEILPEAQKAIEESISLKKANAALAHSLAISLSEHSQILLPQGKFRLALNSNIEAIQILEQAVEQGDTAHQPELGMLLVERANILWQQARLAEAKPLLERAVELIGDKPSRQQDKQKAIEQLAGIQRIMNSGRPYLLDRRWFTHYSELVTYDDLHLLTQAGPFTQDEQAEFTLLSLRSGDDDAKDLMLELAAQSRKREFARSQQEQCVPIICYPFIQFDNVRGRIHDLTALRKEIETQEKHTIVRRLYLEAIDEHLTILRLIESVAQRDQNTVWECNLQLYGKPSEYELKIALQVLCTTLLNVRDHEQAGPIAQDIMMQLQAWGISAYDIVAEELFISQKETAQQVDDKVLKGEKKQFPATVVRKFFQDILNTYNAQNWEVLISPARDHTYVDPNVRKLVLPQKSFTIAKIRQLLAEEIETHTFRALAGQHSSLALLGLGLARQEATEEGLAKWYVRRVNRQVGAEEQENTWIGTLSSGLASGVLTPILSFQELQSFLEKYYLLHRLLTREEAQEEAFAAAKQSAWMRACRTFRGVPDLTQPGCCSLKDGIYLRGHLDVSYYFEHGGDEQRLWVGAIGIENLENVAELDILSPNFAHHHFALMPDMAEQIVLCNEHRT